MEVVVAREVGQCDDAPPRGFLAAQPHRGQHCLCVCGPESPQPELRQPDNVEDRFAQLGPALAAEQARLSAACRRGRVNRIRRFQFRPDVDPAHKRLGLKLEAEPFTLPVTRAARA